MAGNGGNGRRAVRLHRLHEPDDAADRRDREPAVESGGCPRIRGACVQACWRAGHRGVGQPDGALQRQCELRGVSFAYKPGEDVLKNITFHARQGETVALVGHTGSGKSSILNLLFRFYDVERGRITIDGVDVREYAEAAASPAYGHRAAGSVPVHGNDRVQCQPGRSVDLAGEGGAGAARCRRVRDVHAAAAAASMSRSSRRAARCLPVSGS